MSSGSPRQRHPAERPLAVAEQRPDVGRHEAGEVEGVLHAVVEGHLADVVAVVDGRDAHRLEVEHRLHVHRAAPAPRRRAARHAAPASACAAFQLLDAPAGGQVAVDQVVRQVWSVTRSGLMPPACARLTSSGRISAALPSRPIDTALPLGRVACDARQRVVEVRGLLVEVARAQAEVDARSAGTRCSASRRRRRWRPAAARRPCRPGRR